MNYNLNNLNNIDFEHMSQSLLRQLLGNGTISFGDGPDGGREATFDGEANYPNNIIKWSGYWVMQAKYKKVRTIEESKDFDWLKNEIYKELEKYIERKVKVKTPDNLLIFTNIILTPVAKSGGRDKMTELIPVLQLKYKIKNIAIVSYDDIIDLLNNNRDVAIAFSGFILPGDILNKLYELLNKEKSESKRLNDYLARYLEIEFKNNLLSKLEHAGKLTSDKINLEKVFIDLYATPDGNLPEDRTAKIISKTISEANHILKPSLQKISRYVLIAGPGYGKSTLTQYLCQIYRAFFLNKIDNVLNRLTEIEEFLKDTRSVIKVSLDCIRFPFRIILKDYASWIIDQDKKGYSFSVIDYIRFSINKRCNDSYITNSNIEELFFSYPTLLVFDGLDEVPSSSNRQEVLHELNNFTDIILRRIDADAIILATSRPQGYSKEFNIASYRHLIITDLTTEDCLEYITKLLNNIEADADKRKADFSILKKASKDLIVSRLMRSPLQASIMTILVRSGGEPPRNKYELFTEYYSTIFKREKQKSVSKILNEHSAYIDDIHYKLGFTLQSLSESIDSPSATISLNSFKEFVEIYLEKDIELKGNELVKVSLSIIDAATARLVFIEEVQDDLIGFNIRSIQEYFAANYFMQNQPDSIIPQRLQAISTSSYWNNTLLFSIGYIFKHKKYAIDHVESICNELNGSGQYLNLNTLTSIYKHGSWLALDILNEGTFRGHPKFENKFSRLLKQLFSLPFINKHRDISKLPEGIKKDWILSFIEAGIDSNDKNLIFTGFAIASVLIKSGRSELRDLYIKWNLNSVESNELLLFLVKNKLFSKELVFDILFTKIQNGKVLECYEIITSHEVKKILSEIDYSGSDPKIGGELINCLFFSIFYYYISENYDSKILSALLKNESYVSLHELGNLFKGEEKVITFNIVENIYVGEVNIIFVTDLSKLDAFMKAIEFYECDLAKSVVLFYLNPSILSLKNVMYVVNKIHGDAIKHVKNYLANLNWLFHMIFNSRFNNDELISKIESGFFGDDKTWRVTESGFTEKAKENTIEELLAHTSYRRLSIDSPIALESFFNTIFASHTDSEILHAEAIRMLSWAAFDNYGNVKKSINESLEQVILKSYKKCYVENQEDELFDLNITYYIFDLIAFVSSKNLLLNLAELNSAFERVPLKSRNLFSIRENEKLIYAFYKIIGIYKVEIATNPNSSIIRLVPLLLTQESLSLSLFNSKKNEINIEFNYKSIDPINQFSLACLLLLCLPNDISHAAKIENLLNGLDLTDEMIEVYLKILEKMNFTKDINMILLLLNNKVTNYSHRSLYLAILKNFVESQPSNITEIM